MGEPVEGRPRDPVVGERCGEIVGHVHLARRLVERHSDVDLVVRLHTARLADRPAEADQGVPVAPADAPAERVAVDRHAHRGRALPAPDGRELLVAEDERRGRPARVQHGAEPQRLRAGRLGRSEAHVAHAPVSWPMRMRLPNGSRMPKSIP